MHSDSLTVDEMFTPCVLRNPKWIICDAGSDRCAAGENASFVLDRLARCLSTAQSRGGEPEAPCVLVPVALQKLFNFAHGLASLGIVSIHHWLRPDSGLNLGKDWAHLSHGK